MSVVANPVEIGGLISRTPGIKSGTPHIAGTGVTVRTIVRYYKLGMSPEEIAAEYPHLSLAQVYGALAYYHANRDEMDLHMAAEEAESDRIEQEHLYTDAPAAPAHSGQICRRNAKPNRVPERLDLTSDL
jgi:uncharacterized protein (DUF433 family)